MNFCAETLPPLLPDPRRSARTRAACRALLERRRAGLSPRRRRAARRLDVWALGGIGAAYFAALVLSALRLYSSR